MADHVNWGILSAAKIAKDWVAPAIHQSKRGRLAAIASRTPGKAEALAAPYGARVLGDYDALLADPDIDAVYIPLHNADHVPWTRAALQAGKHVLCEKPIALRAEEIDELIAARDATGKLAAEAFMVCHHPQWDHVRDLVANGEIGTLSQVQGVFTYHNPDPANIRNQPELGGGALRDIGVYPLVSTRLVTGAEPLAAQSRITWESGVDASARVEMEFPSFGLDFYVSMRMALRQKMTFHGTRGWITVEAPFNPFAYGDPMVRMMRDGVETRVRFGGVEHYTLQIDAFNDSVRHGTPFACPLEFSRANQVGIDMIYDGEIT
ncbi:Gfo/Idh/MocA family protein [Oceanibium sediminis]|uniref:Gfo/Idh/MocA family protein n=1 Tax=Oceanibium sediminis TaxID=2026339 RepID=UPI000DD3B376|nr:Gfo/Idh/MocA family oxidoreductase [Oceanibium sediminis]